MSQLTLSHIYGKIKYRKDELFDWGGQCPTLFDNELTSQC